MSMDDLSALSRRDGVRVAAVVVAIVIAVVWVTVQFMKPLPSRRIVLASGPEFGLYHRYAERYKQILARDGVTVEERMTSGAAENMQLLLDANSKVDVAFAQGGIGAPADADVVMIAGLYYEPMWIFHRASERLGGVKALDGKRVAVGTVGSGTRAVVDKVLAANGLTLSSGVGRGNTDLLALGGMEALDAVKTANADAAFFIGGATTPLIRKALLDPTLDVLNFDRADAYPRIFPYLSKLTLPRGTIDLGVDIPHEDLTLVGTKAMLVTHDDLHPALVNLLFDAAAEVHAGQGAFEAAGEFPNTTPVDLPVSPQADRHKRFGPSFLYRVLPFWLAALVERTIILVVPVIVVLIPVFNYMPQLLRWRIRSRIFRWYGELALLERDIASRQGELPIEKWRRDLDRIDQGAADLRPPSRFASEVYTLREHVALVRRALGDRLSTSGTPVAT